MVGFVTQINACVLARDEIHAVRK